jgi:hypothetical protein
MFISHSKSSASKHQNDCNHFKALAYKNGLGNHYRLFKYIFCICTNILGNIKPIWWVVENLVTNTKNMAIF